MQKSKFHIYLLKDGKENGIEAAEVENNDAKANEEEVAEQGDGEADGDAEKKKKKKRNRNKGKGKCQTDPPTIPIVDLYPEGKQPLLTSHYYFSCS